MESQEYVGFWMRFGAAVIDSILMALLVAPILGLVFGTDYLITPPVQFSLGDVLLNYLLPAAVVILFWIYRSATPGKMLLKMKIVDAKDGGKPKTGQLVIRYLGYYVSTLPLLLGLIWVGFDARKQGWHDKLAGTVVVRNQD